MWTLSRTSFLQVRFRRITVELALPLVCLYSIKAYIQTDDFESLGKVNTGLLEVAVRAVEEVAPNLESVVLQTGGKG
jgi:hypothetical protein